VNGHIESHEKWIFKNKSGFEGPTEVLQRTVIANSTSHGDNWFHFILYKLDEMKVVAVKHFFFIRRPKTEHS
jgi:hypothetical protein